MTEFIGPPLDCDQDELLAYILSMVNGERVQEFGQSAIKGLEGNVYRSSDTGTVCIKWDNGMGTSFTGGARRIVRPSYTYAPGDMVAYMPPHANGNLHHEGVEFGVVSSVNDDMIFVKFHKQLSKHGWGGTTAQACYPWSLIQL